MGQRKGPLAREFAASGPFSLVLAGVGFEPTSAEPTVLQAAPFGHSAKSQVAARSDLGGANASGVSRALGRLASCGDQSDVDDLQAAGDAEHRQPAGQRLPAQLRLGAVPCRVGWPGRGDPLCAVQRGIDVCRTTSVGESIRCIQR